MFLQILILETKNKLNSTYKDFIPKKKYKDEKQNTATYRD